MISMDLMILMKLNGFGFQQFAWTSMNAKMAQIRTALMMTMGKYVRLTLIVLILKALTFAIVQKDRSP